MPCSNPWLTLSTPECYHVFHDFCFEQWFAFASHSACPLYQQQFYPNLKNVHPERSGNSHDHHSGVI